MGMRRREEAKRSFQLFRIFSFLLKIPAAMPPARPPAAMRAWRKPYISEAFPLGKERICMTITGRLMIMRAERKKFTAVQQRVSLPISFFSRVMKRRLSFMSPASSRKREQVRSLRVKGM